LKLIILRPPSVARCAFHSAEGAVPQDTLIRILAAWGHASGYSYGILAVTIEN
jgi:hypothetical protein